MKVLIISISLFLGNCLFAHEIEFGTTQGDSTQYLGNNKSDSFNFSGLFLKLKLDLNDSIYIRIEAEHKEIMLDKGHTYYDFNDSTQYTFSIGTKF